MRLGGVGFIVLACISVVSGLGLVVLGLLSSDMPPVVHWGWIICGALLLICGCAQAWIGVAARRRR